MQNIDKILLKEQLLLVEREHKPFKGLNTVKIIKAGNNSIFKVGDEILVDKDRLIEVNIDGEYFPNYYLINEEFYKAQVNVTV